MISILTLPVGRPYTVAAKIAFVGSWLFIVTGAVLLGYTGYAIMDANVYQKVETIKLQCLRPSVPVSNSTLREPLRAVPIGEVIGEIQVSRVGLKAIVVEGTSLKILRRAVGHVPTTAMPGEPGNMELAGHRDSFFRALHRVQEGDIIIIHTPARDFRYEVQSMQVVSPRDRSVLRHSAIPVLTLITCFPFDYIGPVPERFVVRARQVM
jgi:sortase A